MKCGSRRSALLLSSALAGLLGLGGVASAADQTYQFDIPAEPLGQALTDFSRASSQQIVFSEDVTTGKVTKGLHGRYTASEALDALLAGTSLHVETSTSGVMMVRSKNAQAASSEAAANGTSAPIETVVVTGTNIRGQAPIGSSLDVYTRVEIEQTGAKSLDQFARSSLDNFSGADGIAQSGGNQLASAFGQTGSALALSSSAAFNLYGLGPSATLTLINGHRVAQSGASGTFVDISQIPLGAVDRIEVLGDGASAIYGSDAVAGVVNVVMRKDFTGAETSLLYGGASSGGGAEFQASQTLGTSWNSGNALVAYQHDQQDPVDVSQRSFIPNILKGGPATLIPETSGDSIFLTARQEIGPTTSLSIDAIHSAKNTFGDNYTPITSTQASLTADSIRTILSGATVDLKQALFGDWSLDLTGNYSAQAQAENSHLTVKLGGSTIAQQTSLVAYHSLTQGVDAVATGTVTSIPGGSVRAAFGGSLRDERFEPALGGAKASTYARQVSSLFGEVSVPIIGESNAQGWARRLEISAAARFDHYTDFGETINPKVGLLWVPTEGLNLRATYGKSFQAPSLTDLYTPNNYYTTLYADPTAPGGARDLLVSVGGNRSLGPQTSTSSSIGFDWEPSILPNVLVHGTYFSINFNDRIGTAPTGGIPNIFASAVLAPYILLNPPIATVQSYFSNAGFLGDRVGRGAAGVTAIFNESSVNLASNSVSGLNLSGRYVAPTDFGDFGITIGAQYYLKNTYQTVVGAAPIKLLNTYGEPTQWKAHSTLSYEHGELNAGLTINYVNSYADTLLTPPGKISAWATADLNVSYSTGDAIDSVILRHLTLTASILNLTDSDPPFVSIPAGISSALYRPIDPANASPMGRFISLRLTKSIGAE